MEFKPEKALLAPWRETTRGIQIFLQKRDKDAKALPDYFGFWGGGIERGETPEQALLREIHEELSLTISNYSFIKKFEYDTVIKHLWHMKVGDNFESTIEIHEGQYGKFFNEEGIKLEKMIIGHDLDTLNSLFTHLRKTLQ